MLRVYISAENIWTHSSLYKLTKDFDVENTGVSDQVFSTMAMLVMDIIIHDERDHFWSINNILIV